MGGQRCPKEMRNPPDSESGGIRLSLVIVNSHFIDWGTTCLIYGELLDDVTVSDVLFVIYG